MTASNTAIAILYLTLWINISLVRGQDQLCTGSLGDNIFEEGDFGRGNDVIYPHDPELAPGYRYTTYTPLQDGEYTITNNIGEWWHNWPTWMGIRDRSEDPKGYMMVVNASFEPGVFYEQMVDGVCENTLYEFSADVVNVIYRQTRGHHDPNVSFLIDGKVMFNTGNVLQDERWRTAGFTFRTKPGQTAVRLTLRNNAPGGTGNDLALDNISFRACGPVATIESDAEDVICEDDEFPILTASIQDTRQRYIRWQMRQKGNQRWSDMGLTDKTIQADPLPPGQYEYRFVHAPTEGQLSSEKCRAASDVKYLVVKPAEYHSSASVDHNESYMFGNQRLTESGVYELSYPRMTGCDSVIVLTLTVAAPPVVAMASVPSPVTERPHAVAPLNAEVQLYEPVSCHGERYGSLRVVCEGGVAPYTVRWSSGGTRGIEKNLKPGDYSVTVTDSKGIETVAYGEIHEPEKLRVVLTNINPADKGVANGTASLRTDETGLTYRWDNGRSTAEVNDLTSGKHAVTVSNSSGCEMIVYCDIPERDPPPRKTPELTAEALKSGAVIRMESLHFKADSSSITDDSYASLMELYQLLDENPELIIEIGGHTNGLPEHEYCDRLSKDRARSVAVWIVERGIEESRVFYKGYGKRKPVASNKTLEGRKKNQRVEVRMVEGN